MNGRIQFFFIVSVLIAYEMLMYVCLNNVASLYSILSEKKTELSRKHPIINKCIFVTTDCHTYLPG